MQVRMSDAPFSFSGVLPQQRMFAATQPASSTESAASSSSTVTISQAARDLATSEAPRNVYAAILDDAKADPAYAKKEAERFAYDDSWELHGPLVDITHDPIRYSATGEVVTDESMAAFKAEAAKVTSGRIALYQAEKAKGTPDAQILEKLYAFVDTQSENYRSKLNWVGVSQTNVVRNAG